MSEDGKLAAAEAAEPEAKKLRSSDEDLKVIIGSGKDETVRWYHAPTLASKSKYIDAMLAAPMKERDTGVISFPDVSAETWDTMMKFVENPIAARRMTAKDVMEVAKHYDQYEFCDGRLLCDEVLLEHFKATKRGEKTGPPDIGVIIDAVAVAHDTNLKRSFEEGMKYIWSKIGSIEVPYGRTMFTVEHMKRVAPLLIAYRETHNVNTMMIGQLERELHKPEFPTRFVEKCKSWLTHKTFYSFISHIELSGCSDANGEYTCDTMPFAIQYDRDKIMTWGGVQVKINIQLKKEGWAIVRETLPVLDEDGEPDYDSVIENDCWVSPCSVNLPLPPRSGWKPADPLAHGTPKIKYILHKEGIM